MVIEIRTNLFLDPANLVARALEKSAVALFYLVPHMLPDELRER